MLARRRLVQLLLLTAFCGASPFLAAQTPGSDAALRPPNCGAVPSDAELERSHARIGRILFDIRPIFDPNNPADDKWLFHLINGLHVPTHEATVRAQLLFRPGDRYSRAILDETARIMRVNYAFVREPLIRPVCYRDGLVDIEVLTHEVWTLQPGIEFGRSGGTNAYGVDLADSNFLGLGKSVELGHLVTVYRTSNFINWADPNVAGTHWVDAASFAKNSDGTAWGLAGFYPFVALESPYTLGADISNDHGIVHRYSLGQVYDAYDNDWLTGDVYAGKALLVTSDWTDRLTLGWHVDRSQFYSTPEALTLAPLPAQRDLSYPYLRMRWLQNDYDTMQNLDLIARTEDVHFGLDASVGLGVAAPWFGSDRDAVLPDAEVNYGFRFGPAHELFILSRVAARLEDGAVQDFLGTQTVDYFLATSDRSRLLLRVIAKEGHDLDIDHYLELGGDDGLRGYPLRYQNGSQDALFTVEERFYTRWSLLRLFNIGGAVFFDAGRTWGYTPVPTPNLGLLKDAGVGLRLGNARSSLGSVIHVDLAFPFETTPAISRTQFLVSTQATF